MIGAHRRRQNVGEGIKICVRCSKRVARHKVYGERLCCRCYVGDGHKPAYWHPECMAAAAALRNAPQ
jgi:hypothetical protein